MTTKFNYVWSHISKSLKDFGELISPYITISGGPTPDANNNLIVANSSQYTVIVPDGESHSIPDFSGMLIVNDHYDGRVETWIAGGGSTVLLGATNLNGDPCGSTLEIGDNGYIWTNVDNLGQDVGLTFTVIKTRNEA